MHQPQCPKRMQSVRRRTCHHKPVSLSTAITFSSAEDAAIESENATVADKSKKVPRRWVLALRCAVKLLINYVL